MKPLLVQPALGPTHSFFPSRRSCLAISRSRSSCWVILFWYCFSLSRCCFSCCERAGLGRHTPSLCWVLRRPRGTPSNRVLRGDKGHMGQGLATFMAVTTGRGMLLAPWCGGQGRCPASRKAQEGQPAPGSTAQRRRACSQWRHCTARLWVLGTGAGQSAATASRVQRQPRRATGPPSHSEGLGPSSPALRASDGFRLRAAPLPPPLITVSLPTAAATFAWCLRDRAKQLGPRVLSQKGRGRGGRGIYHVSQSCPSLDHSHFFQISPFQRTLR